MEVTLYEIMALRDYSRLHNKREVMLLREGRNNKRVKHENLKVYRIRIRIRLCLFHVVIIIIKFHGHCYKNMGIFCIHAILNILELCSFYSDLKFYKVIQKYWNDVN